jgi:hypothetical protein
MRTTEVWFTMQLDGWLQVKGENMEGCLVDLHNRLKELERLGYHLKSMTVTGSTAVP